MISTKRINQLSVTQKLNILGIKKIPRQEELDKIKKNQKKR